MQQPPAQPPHPVVRQDGGQVPPVQQTNGFAVAALVAGIMGLTLCPGFGSVFALIFGYVARGQIKRSQDTQGGNGMAITGIVLGWIGVVISIVIFALFIAGSIALFGFTQSESFDDAVDQGVEFVAEGSLDEVTEAEARCTGIEKYPSLGRDHIEDGATARYNSNPPTSGPHYAVPAEAGFYAPDSGIEPERLVHNLEHGQIVIWYRPVAEDLGFLQEQVETLVAQEPLATVGAPYPNMNDGYNIVITSWTRARACARPSQEVVDDFRRRFQGRAPEPLTPAFKG